MDAPGKQPIKVHPLVEIRLVGRCSNALERRSISESTLNGVKASESRGDHSPAPSLPMISAFRNLSIKPMNINLEFGHIIISINY